MAKMVGMNVVVKEGWTKKAIALLSEKLTEEEGEYRERIEKVKCEHLFSYGSAGAEGVNYILKRLTEIQKKRKENK